MTMEGTYYHSNIFHDITNRKVHFKGSILLVNSPQNLILLTKLIEQFDFELQDLILWQKQNVIPRKQESKKVHFLFR